MDKPKPYNAGTVNGATIGQVTSKEELMTSLEMANASPEQVKTHMAAFDTAMSGKPEKKKKSMASSLYDAVMK